MRHSELKKLDEYFQRNINKKNISKADIITSKIINDNESYLVETIKYDRLLDDNDDLNMSFESIRNNYS